MLRIPQLALPLDADREELLNLAAKRLGVRRGEIASLHVVKRAVDARKKQDVHFVYTVEATLHGNEDKVLQRTKATGVTQSQPYEYPLPSSRPLKKRPVVVGFGPAGMFAALVLARAGQRPIVVERGAAVEQRVQQVQAFWNGGALCTESNVQFGEGGAGTFSDGKLNTGTKDGRAGMVLREFAAAGAPQEILYEAKPHIGTDLLPGVVRKIRETILSLGGEIYFETRFCGLRTSGGRVCAVELERGERFCIETEHVILAIGHSARDTFEMLLQANVTMEPKPFSIGARIEHAQEMIDRAQYGGFAGHPALGAADYKLAVHLPNGRGVYTFCMCPGGEVVAAASEQGGVVTNGMSRFARDGKNANSALLVGVGPQDFESAHPLAGVAFQRRWEQAAFTLGGGDWKAPAQQMQDFLKGRASRAFGEVSPSYLPGVRPCALDSCLPDYVVQSMQQGILEMDKRLRGFADADAVLTGVETRSSSPVRITRGADCQSLSMGGLYPCGEGAGYAGGIVSAAVDGVRCAEQVLRGEEL